MVAGFQASISGRFWVSTEDHAGERLQPPAGGQSAAAKRDYIEREGRYERDRDELEHRESGHMPAWAQDDPRAYWQAADDHERANGRLYSEIQFALPRELDASGRQALAGAFAERVCTGERLPYTLALHRDGPDGANPHAHLMFSERGNDGIVRTCRAVVHLFNATFAFSSAG